MRLRRLSGSPATFWVAALAASLLTGLTAAHLVSRARHDAVLYGAPVPVVVAVHRVEAGEAVRPSDLTVRPVPSSWSPPGALAHPGAAAGRTVVVPLLAGLPVTAEHLAPEGLSGLSALLRPGERAVAVPRDSASVPLQRGDRVDVVASEGGGPGGEAVAAVRLVAAAPVLQVGEEAASLAVPEERAAGVAAAALEGVLTLAVSAPPPAPAPPPPPRPGRPRTGPASASAPAAAHPTPPPLP